MENDCLFCKIANGKVPAEIIYENEHTLAFLDIHPVNRGHTLVIPKVHTNNIYTASREVFAHVMEAVHFLAPKIKNSMGAEGINIGINNDKAAGQIIFHLHAHIIPRFEADGHAHWHGNPYQDAEIRSMKDIIIQELK